MIRILLILVFLATPLMAVEPDEILDDPVLEARARTLSKGLRCLVCRNENIDDSNADLARDLRLLLRERLVAGDTDEEAVGFIVARYGEFVLLKPPFTPYNMFLWASAPVFLVIGIGMSVVFIRRKKPPIKELSEAESTRIAEILAD
jgi:cytochrome c-type biogenesis protein CcmH